jgi:hypothetical protein
MKKTVQSLFAAALVLGGVAFANAWTPPPGAAPTCPAGTPGCDAPINTGSASQGRIGNLGIGILTPNRALEVYSAGEGITFGRQSDNVNSIQGYIDAHWSDRTTYASGCCNMLKIQPDVGQVEIGNNVSNNSVNLIGNVYANGSVICRANGTGCPSGSAGVGFGGIFGTTEGTCNTVNAYTNACNCPAWAPHQRLGMQRLVDVWFDEMRYIQIWYCTAS